MLRRVLLLLVLVLRLLPKLLCRFPPTHKLL